MIRLLFVFLLCSLPQTALAEVRIAVLDFRSTMLDTSVLQILSNKVRVGVLDASKNKTVQGESLLIMTRENTMLLLEDMGSNLSDIQY